VPNVLLVDDDPIIRSAVGDIIRRFGHHVTACSGVTEAILLLASTPFDLVLTDFQLTDGSGESVVYAARNLCPKATRAVMTGNIHLVPGSLTAAAHKILEKPFLYSAVAALF
jgi:DNA-binding NtrC family response regulator